MTWVSPKPFYLLYEMQNILENLFTGIPHRWQHAHVRIYPPESKARNMSFIVSGSNPDKRQVEDLLRQITGGRVIIHDIKPYTGQEPGTEISWRQASSQTDK